MKGTEPSGSRAASPPWARDVIDRFRNHLVAERRTDSTVRKYVDDSATKFLSWCIEQRIQLEGLTEEDMMAYQLHLAQRGLSDNSIIVEIAAINKLVEEVLNRPDLRMTPPKWIESKKFALTEDEVQKILDESKKNPRNQVLICLLYYAMLRAAETTKLHIVDVDLENKQVKVRAGKGKDHSLVLLSDYAVEALRNYLSNDRPGIPGSDKSPYLLLSVWGNPLARSDVWRIVKKVAFDAGVDAKRVHPHIFRHSAITHMAEKGVDALKIQPQSRHKHLDDLMRYVHISGKSRRDAFESAFNGNGKNQAHQGGNGENGLIQPQTSQVAASEDKRSALIGRLVDLFESGKLTGEQLDKLVSAIGGSASRKDAT